MKQLPPGRASEATRAPPTARRNKEAPVGSMPTGASPSPVLKG